MTSNVEAKKIVLAPVNVELNVDQEFTLWIKGKLIGKTFVEGEMTYVPFERLGFEFPLSIVETRPKGVVKMTGLTYLKILNKPVDDEENEPTEKIKMKEIMKEVVIKVRCPHCRNTYDETMDKCPHCGAPHV